MSLNTPRRTLRSMLAHELRKQSFTRIYKDRDPIHYQKYLSDRLIEVQLWENGQSRVSRMMIIDGDRNRLHGFTFPTNFKHIIAAMNAAIKIEIETPFLPRPQ